MKVITSLDITKKRFRNDYVLIRVVDIKRPDSPFYDPKQYADKPEIGEVVAITDDIEHGISVGDIVLFNKFSSTKYVNPDTQEELLVVRVDEIICH